MPITKLERPDALAEQEDDFVEDDELDLGEEGLDVPDLADLDDEDDEDDEDYGEDEE